MLKDDLEELEGNKFTKQCETCIFKAEGNWCFMYEEPPTTKKCVSRVVDNQLQALREFYKQYPDIGEK